MANVVIVAGDTGTGKSTAIETLIPEETAIIQVVDKPLPFGGSKNTYSSKNGNLVVANKSADIVNAINEVSKIQRFNKLIIDDIGFSMLDEFFEKASITGYDKFAKMGVNMQKIIVAAKNLPERFDVFLLFHDDKDDSNTKYKLKLIGRMLDDKYNPLAVVSVCIFAEVVFDKEKKSVYRFVTNRTLDESGVIIPAKSPRGMFEDLYINNDFDFISKRMREYYGQNQQSEAAKG